MIFAGVNLNPGYPVRIMLSGRPIAPPGRTYDLVVSAKDSIGNTLDRVAVRFVVQ